MKGLAVAWLALLAAACAHGRGPPAGELAEVAAAIERASRFTRP